MSYGKELVSTMGGGGFAKIKIKSRNLVAFLENCFAISKIRFSGKNEVFISHRNPYIFVVVSCHHDA